MVIYNILYYYQSQPAIQLPTPPQADSVSPQSPNQVPQTNIRQQLEDLSSEDMATPVDNHSAVTNIGMNFELSNVCYENNKMNKILIVFICYGPNTVMVHTQW